MMTPMHLREEFDYDCDEESLPCLDFCDAEDEFGEYGEHWADENFADYEYARVIDEDGNVEIQSTDKGHSVYARQEKDGTWTGEIEWAFGEIRVVASPGGKWKATFTNFVFPHYDVTPEAAIAGLVKALNEATEEK